MRCPVCSSMSTTVRVFVPPWDLERDSKPSSFRTAVSKSHCCTCKIGECKLQRLRLSTKTLRPAGPSIISINRHTHTQKQAKLSRSQHLLLPVFSRELYFHMMTFICARMRERDVCGATVITGFPESSSAMRPIYERASVVSTFLGKTPATLTVVWKGLRHKILIEPSLDRARRAGWAKTLMLYQIINCSNCV